LAEAIALIPDLRIARIATWRTDGGGKRNSRVIVKGSTLLLHLRQHWATVAKRPCRVAAYLKIAFGIVEGSMTVSKIKLNGRSMTGYRGGSSPNFRGQLSSPTVTFKSSLVPL